MTGNERIPVDAANIVKYMTTIYIIKFFLT